MTLGIVDHGLGNRRNVEKALARVGVDAVVTADHEALRRADGLVVPGVGAFPAGMAGLRERGLDELVVERAGDGTPILGLCVGMQLLFERSTELGGDTGLGLLAGDVLPLDAPGHKIPHIGWNVVTFTHASPLTAGLGDAAAFYHVHSFAPRPADEEVVLGRGELGRPFVSLVEHGNVFGAQFHPEKSSTSGLRLLANFARVCAAVRA
ncbi:MAG TPA: imidazole glycerol phosphate synthase subunit HisH [Solirubrobacteraceae bacterium]|nr:imidazole glycerol phosphate synthase subunit HisH [Solirubrobacteraceae bacterium]